MSAIKCITNLLKRFSQWIHNFCIDYRSDTECWSTMRSQKPIRSKELQTPTTKITPPSTPASLDRLHSWWYLRIIFVCISCSNSSRTNLVEEVRAILTHSSHQLGVSTWVEVHVMCNIINSTWKQERTPVELTIMLLVYTVCTRDSKQFYEQDMSVLTQGC